MRLCKQNNTNQSERHNKKKKWCGVSFATNDTASDAAAGVTSGLGVIVTATTKIVFAGVADNGTTNNGVCTIELNHLVDNVDFGNTVITGDNVAKVAMVTSIIIGATMLLA
jgi:hypothetical protein